MLVRQRFVLTAFLPLALTGCAGCESEEAPSQPTEPQVRKLYAPGFEPGDEGEERPTDADGTEGAGAPAETDQLRALLTGEGREDEVEAAEPDPSTPNIDRQRRRRRRSPPTDAIVDEAPAGPSTLSDGAFQSAITDWSGMKRCLASNAGRLPSRSGALRVQFTIRGDGQVVKSDVVETSNEVARAIAPCVERRARRIRFPAFAEAGKEVEKTAKFVF